MPLIERKTLKAIGQKEMLYKSFSEKKQEVILEQASVTYFDIFLSHSYMDREEIIGLRKFLMGFGYRVYIDWIDDEELDRSAVNIETAGRLKNRMDQSKCLLYATTENYKSSIWMPWELGYFDGGKGKVAVIPVVDNTKYDYSGIEYLSLYPYLTESNGLYLKDEKGKFKSFSVWLNS